MQPLYKRIELPKSKFVVNPAPNVVEEVFELKQPNEEIEFVIPVTNPLTGDEYWKRVPNCLLNLRNGSSEIISDISLVIDADLSYPTMSQQMARFEGAYDDDENFEEIENETNEPLSPHEVRAQDAVQRLYQLRLEQQGVEGKQKNKIEADEDQLQLKNLEAETSDVKALDTE